MMKEEVKHLFNRSACLTKRQIEAYLAGNMITEEVYAVEHHINGCPLCSMALDGMQLRKDALEVTAAFNSDFLKTHLNAVQQPTTSGAAAYVKNLKPKEIINNNTKPLMNVLKLGLGIAACAGILWFVKSLGENNKNEPARPEQTVASPAQPEPEEQSVVVEEPLINETTTPEPAVEEAPVQTEPDAGKIGPPPPPEERSVKPAATQPAPAKTTPATTPPAKTTPAKTAATTKTTTPAKTASPLTPAKTPAKTTTSLIPTPVPAPPKEMAVKPEPPKPVPVRHEDPTPRVEEPKPAPPPVTKKEEAEDLPSDPLAAGKALMDKRNYTAAINKMRNEMRSNDKSRRQAAVILVAKCYQQMGNKDRAKELLSSIVDEGGPEKKNAKKLLKEVEKPAE